MHCEARSSAVKADPWKAAAWHPLLLLCRPVFFVAAILPERRRSLFLGAEPIIGHND